MKRKMCGYVYENHEYRTDCGCSFLFRPVGKCDKCGRKPYDKELDHVRYTQQSSPRSK